jgi:hypothetical protein
MSAAQGQVAWIRRRRRRGAAGQAGGGVRDAVAQALRLSLCEAAVQGEQLEPGQLDRGDQGGSLTTPCSSPASRWGPRRRMLFLDHSQRYAHSEGVPGIGADQRCRVRRRVVRLCRTEAS